MKRRNLFIAAAATVFSATSLFAMSGMLQAGVTVEGNARTGVPARADEVQNTLTVPFNYEPTEAQFQSCQLHTYNNESDWTYGTGLKGQPAFCQLANGTTFCYAWFLLPKINFTEPGLYELTYYIANSSKYSSRNTLSVFLLDSNTPEVLRDATDNGKYIETYPELQTQEEWELKTIKLNISEPCEKYLGFYVTGNAKREHVYVSRISMEKAPASPPLPPTLDAVDFNGGNGTITVTLPTEAYGNTPLSGELTANFYVDNSKEGEAKGNPGATVSCQIRDLDKGPHTIKVTVSQNGLISDFVEQSIVVTSPNEMRYTLPFDLNLGENFIDFTVVDVNKDGYTWTRDGDAIKYSGSSQKASDDWIFTRCVQLTDEDIAYILKVGINAKVPFSSFPENFDVWIGTAANPEAMTQKLIEVIGVSSTSYTNYSNEFAVGQAGDYVIGIHAVGSQIASDLLLENLTMEATETSSITPAAPVNAYAEGAETGALEANVYFTFPSKTAFGLEISADTELTATATCGTNTATTTGKPGATGYITVAATQEGINTITLVCSNDAGNGIPVTLEANCGLDIPTTPRIVGSTVSEDNYSVKLQWRKVTTGVNEGNVNADGMRYRIYLFDNTTGEPTLVDDVNKNNYTYTVPSTVDTQDTYSFGIEAYNGPDSNSEDMARVSAVLGKPYQLPMEDGFTDGKLIYNPITITSSLSGDKYIPDWYYGDPGQINLNASTCFDGWALIGRTKYSGGDSTVEFPKFSSMLTPSAENMVVDGIKLVLTVYVYSSIPPMEIRGVKYGYEEVPITIGKINSSMGDSQWVDVEFDLPAELCNQPWVAIQNYVNFDDTRYNWALIDSYSFLKSEHLDLGVEALDTNGRSVKATRGAVTLRGYEGTEVTITTVDGRIFGTHTVNADQWTAVLNPGLYIIKTVEGSHKVIVK